MHYRVDAQGDGKTVLEVMRHTLSFSAAHIRHLKFLPDGILVNGAHVTVRHVLREGELLTLAAEDTQSGETLIPVCLPLAIAYEDSDVVIPDKPADMPTHPSCGHRTDTVANALAFRYEQQGIPFVFRPISRLDRNTSGLLTVARHRIAAASLTRAMQHREFHKQYLAIVSGIPPKEEDTVETYIRRTAQSVILRENCSAEEGGDLALTHYRVLCADGGYALVCAAPLTGRTHQLRVHFAGLGCPIAGDDLYGTPTAAIGRHALHSAMLSFPLPSGEGRKAVTSPLPDDMYALAIQAFGKARTDAALAFAYRDFFDSVSDNAAPTLQATAIKTNKDR